MKLEINDRRKPGKFTHMWKQNDTLLNNQQVKDKVKGKSKNLETNENGNTAYQDLWDVAKTEDIL